MKIKKIKISNYRSINNLNFEFDQNNNFISLCGANNVGKTNVLNAISLFFNNKKYIPEKDAPNHKYYGTRGGHWQPKIEITFINGEEEEITIKKDWNITNSAKKEIKKDYKIEGYKNKKDKIKDPEKVLNEINFFFLKSINISFPEVIKYIMNSDIIDIETGNTRMAGRKKSMKESLEKVLEELKNILEGLSNNISPLLEKYKEGWGVAFDLPKQINTFRDLMIGEIDFYIKDKSNSKFIDAKGSGLQRLSHILMHFRILEKINEKKKSAIVLIDEPDVYLHSGLQKKLLKDIKKFSKQNQIIITTHSPIFIDTVKLSNVFLLDQKIESKKYKRASRKSGNREFNIIETKKVDLESDNGISVLKEYLGIEDSDYLLFDNYNVLVEGEADKIYLKKLLESFNLSIPKIIPVHGADNMLKYLEFYNSLVNKSTKKEIKFLCILDNDEKGREILKKINKKTFNNIEVNTRYIISFFGYDPDEKKKSNIEIEDFINPEIIIYLVNKILSQKGLKMFNKKKITEIIKKIKQPAFQNNGILQLIENEKNSLNPEYGIIIKIDSDGVKSGMVNIFNNLNKNIINLIGNNDDSKNKFIYKFLQNLSNQD